MSDNFGAGPHLNPAAPALNSVPATPVLNRFCQPAQWFARGQQSHCSKQSPAEFLDKGAPENPFLCFVAVLLQRDQVGL